MGKKIAIIEDDPDILKVLEIIFDNAQFETRSTMKAGETSSIVRSFQPDIILLDVLLSGKDGRTICKKLKTDGATKKIPVIMMSAHPNAKKSVMEVGADAFISKPFDIDDLVKLVEKHIS